MKKKIMSLCLVVALGAIAVIGGTLAYFTDSDADVNVMTAGNVKIVQDEWQSNDDNTGFEKYENGKALFPYTGKTDASGIASEYNAQLYYPDADGNLKNGGKYAFSAKNNAIDKIVTVKNTGTLPAYIRTLFAFEIARDKDGNAINPAADGVDQLNYSMMGLSNFKWTDAIITIDGVEFVVGEFYYGYNKVDEKASSLAAGKTSYPSLLQVYLNSKVGNEWYDNFGQYYNIIAVSQATQMTGFDSAEQALDTAFADVTAANAATIQGWFVDNTEDNVVFVETVHPVVDGNADPKLSGTDTAPVAG